MRSDLVLPIVALVLALVAGVVRIKRFGASGNRLRMRVLTTVIAIVAGTSLWLFVHRNDHRRAAAPPAASASPSTGSAIPSPSNTR